MTRLLGILGSLTAVAFGLALAVHGTAALPKALSEEALLLRLFWESDGYMRSVAMGWYPALPRWIAVPLYPLSYPLAGYAGLLIAMTTLGLTLVLAGALYTWKALRAGGASVHSALAASVASGCLMIALFPNGGSIYSASLFAVAAFALHGLVLLHKCADRQSVAVLGVGLGILPLHSLDGFFVAVLILGAAAFSLRLSSLHLQASRSYVLFLAAALGSGTLTIAYLQIFYGETTAGVLRNYEVALAQRQVLAAVYARFGSFLPLVLMWIAAWIAVARWIVLRRPMKLATAIVVTITMLAFWSYSVPQETSAADDLIISGLPEDAGTILVDDAAISPDSADFGDLGTFTFPHMPGFAKALAGVVGTHTFALDRTPDSRFAIHRRVPVLLARVPHTMVWQQGDWTLYRLSPSMEHIQ